MLVMIQMIHLVLGPLNMVLLQIMEVLYREQVFQTYHQIQGITIKLLLIVHKEEVEPIQETLEQLEITQL